jgi:AcrR family transcriptional regulator
VNSHSLSESTVQTRKERDRQVRQDDFLSAAERLFAEKGYQHAAMEDIAKAAGYATGTIYRYFKSKGDLYRHLLIRRAASYLGHLQSRLQAEKTSLGRLRAIIRGKFDFFAANREFMVLYLDIDANAVLRRPSPGDPEEEQRLRSQCQGQLRMIFEAGARTGELDADLLAEFFETASNQLLVECFRRDGGKSLDRIEKFLMQFFERALALPQSSRKVTS